MSTLTSGPASRTPLIPSVATFPNAPPVSSVPAASNVRSGSSVPPGSGNLPAGNTLPGETDASGSQAGPVSNDATFIAIDKAYREVWGVCPYTSFVMFEQILSNVRPRGGGNALGTWGNFLAKGTNTLEGAGLLKEDVQLPLDENIWKSLWSGNSGLCTSFSIRVANQSNFPDVEYGDTGFHRAAWQIEDQSAVVIDSSAREVINLPDMSVKMTLSVGPKLSSWNFNQGVLVFTVREKTDVDFRVCLTPVQDENSRRVTQFESLGSGVRREAMRLCLQQLITQKTMVLLFRWVHSPWQPEISTLTNPLQQLHRHETDPTTQARPRI